MKVDETIYLFINYYYYFGKIQTKINFISEKQLKLVVKGPRIEMVGYQPRRQQNRISNQIN